MIITLGQKKRSQCSDYSVLIPLSSGQWLSLDQCRDRRRSSGPGLNPLIIGSMIITEKSNCYGEQWWLVRLNPLIIGSMIITIHSNSKISNITPCSLNPLIIGSMIITRTSFIVVRTSQTVLIPLSSGQWLSLQAPEGLCKKTLVMS